MSYVKYREDDEEIVNNRHYMTQGSTINTCSQESPQYYDCKYCRKVFDDRKQLFQHIKQKHNIVRPLIVINGRIADSSYVIHSLEEAYIELFGYEEDISVNDRVLNIEHGKDTIDITKDLRSQFRKNSACSVVFQDATVEIRLEELNIHKNPEISAIIDQWEQDISAKKKLSTTDFNFFDDVNRMYLTGIYNYYIATQARKDKAKRYDDALDLLSRFDSLDGIGNCILKIIAFRRNWVKRLEMLTNDGRTDIFSVASDYYQHKESAFTDFPSGKDVYIEDSTKMSLDLILLFQQGKYNLVKKKLSEIPDIDDLDDPNLQDQLNLISARIALIDKNDRKAAFYYEKLAAPAFKDEYQLYKKGDFQLKS